MNDNDPFNAYAPRLPSGLSQRRRSIICAMVLVITKLDRLARSVAHLTAIGERLDSKGVALQVLDQAIDTSTPTGRLMLTCWGLSLSLSAS